MEDQDPSLAPAPTGPEPCFLADLSHEARSPLNAIIGFSELLADGAFGPLNPEQAAAVCDLLTAGQHLQRLLSDALDLARLDAGQLAMQCEVLSAAAVCEQALAASGARAQKLAVTLNSDVPADLAVWADERRLIQVLEHLLLNALRHSPSGAVVHVTARAAGPVVTLSVIDHGPGLALADHERVFHAFVALPAANTVPGPGLGLALSRRLAETMGGTLTLHSAPGHGATFTLTLPRRDIPQ